MANIERVNEKNREKRILELEMEMAALDMSDSSNLSTYQQLHAMQLDLIDRCVEYKKINSTKGIEIFKGALKVLLVLGYPVAYHFIKKAWEDPEYKGILADAVRLGNERF